MNAILEAESTLTDRYQTTVPEPVRRALGLQKRDALHYEVLPDGEVRLSRAQDQRSDPVVTEFLCFLETDIRKGNLSLANSDVVASLRELVRDVEFDINAALSPDDE